MTPSLTHKGGPGVNLTSYLDSSHMVSQYLLISSSRSKNKGDIRGKDEIGYFMTPVWGGGGGGGGGGGFDFLSRLSTYGFLLPPNTFYGSKCNT